MKLIEGCAHTVHPRGGGRGCRRCFGACRSRQAGYTGSSGRCASGVSLGADRHDRNVPRISVVVVDARKLPLLAAILTGVLGSATLLREARDRDLVLARLGSALVGQDEDGPALAAVGADGLALPVRAYLLARLQRFSVALSARSAFCAPRLLAFGLGVVAECFVRRFIPARAGAPRRCARRTGHRAVHPRQRGRNRGRRRLAGVSAGSSARAGARVK